MINLSEKNITEASPTDPVILAIRRVEKAKVLHNAALTALELAGAFAHNPPSSQLEDLEETEIFAGKNLITAEKIVLDMKPTTIEGSLALLSHLRNRLDDYPNLVVISSALSTVEEALIKFHRQ